MFNAIGTDHREAFSWKCSSQLIWYQAIYRGRIILYSPGSSEASSSSLQSLMLIKLLLDTLRVQLSSASCQNFKMRCCGAAEAAQLRHAGTVP